MLIKTMAVLATALIVGTASAALANDSSGEYKGGALFGPLPGQVFHYARPGVPGASAFAYVPGHGRVVVRAPNLRAEYPTAPWE